MRTLFFDCFSGISGDMTVGALHDLGVPEHVFRDALAQLALPEGIHLHFSRESRQHIEGVKFDVHAHSHEHEHEHADHGHSHGAHDHHSHGHHAHSHEPHDHSHAEDAPHVHGRSFAEIAAFIAGSGLDPWIKEKATAVFRRVAVAEGKIHGMPPESVTFHEVGAVDSIADIVCACAGLHHLGVDAIAFSPLFEGTGWINCAHGKFPLPAPATLEILAGIPLRQIDEPMEFITPTGAAIAAEFGSGFGPMPTLAVEQIGYGVGTRDRVARPNVLRAVLGESASAGSETDEVVELAANLDDLTPELAAAAAERLLAAGALDVWLDPVLMKKGRPGFVLTALCAEDKIDGLFAVLVRETTAFGMRYHRVSRRKLRREMRDVETPFGAVAVKLGWHGDELVQASPEYSACLALAEKNARPVREVYEAAKAAALG